MTGTPHSAFSPSLENRVAAVTGAGGGIGAAVVRAFSQWGAKVALLDFDLEAARSAADEIDGALALEVDITDRGSCEAAAEQISNRLGTTSILVNCAGYWGPYSRFTKSDPDQAEKEIEVNLTGTLNMTRALLPQLEATGDSAIVNVASEAGRSGEFGLAAYSAAKAGVIGFSKALARELGRSGVRVNCVAPSATRTGATQEALDALDREKLLRAYPLGRLGEPDDMAAAVLFLASPMSAWITGQVLSVNGGYSIQG